MAGIDKIGYVRVSTFDQEQENQIKILMDAGIPTDYIFSDKGISGTMLAEKRPGFQRAMQYINLHKDEVRFLYVYEISRLGRTTLETLNLIDSLEKSGIMVWSLSPKEGFTRTEEAITWKTYLIFPLRDCLTHSKLIIRAKLIRCGP